MRMPGRSCALGEVDIMQNPYDQLAKQIGEEALAPFGTTVVHDEISPEIQYADLRHEPAPARAADRQQLGLLGQIASILCLIRCVRARPRGADPATFGVRAGSGTDTQSRATGDEDGPVQEL